MGWANGLMRWDIPTAMEWARSPEDGTSPLNGMGKEPKSAGCAHGIGMGKWVEGPTRMKRARSTLG